MSANSHEGLYSVSVAGVVVDEQGRVLAIQRRDNGHWEAPGGVLDHAETFEQGVEREVLEETGLQVRVDRLTGVYKNMQRHIVALVYRCAPLGGQLGPTDESIRTDWLTLSQVQERMSPAYAVRVLDAFSDAPVSRAHDGVQVLDQTNTPPQ